MLASFETEQEMVFGKKVSIIVSRQNTELRVILSFSIHCHHALFQTLINLILFWQTQPEMMLRACRSQQTSKVGGVARTPGDSACCCLCGRLSAASACSGVWNWEVVINQGRVHTVCVTDITYATLRVPRYSGSIRRMMPACEAIDCVLCPHRVELLKVFPASASTHPPGQLHDHDDLRHTPHSLHQAKNMCRQGNES